ncbi:MAG: hypothetical protein J6P83_03155 [Bacteroidales bacterium]|nr:hypothetical protein [Bacteroidales bacterium]
MNNQSLSASAYQFSNTFFSFELESILCECVVIYNDIVNQQIKFPNDEEIIRDGFLRYLKDDNYKNGHFPLYNYHFDKEVKDGLGRLDIRILPLNPYCGDSAFYSIECKRLNNTNVNGSSGLNAEYIMNGICRYVIDYYSTHYDTNTMFGFVVEQMDIDKNINSINGLLPYDYINKQGMTVNANAKHPLQYFDFANGYPYSYISTHTHISGKEIVLYHLMFDFSNSII